ncbi:MAG TPA: three-Cys-motif partner protein TcmP [Thermoguttaceae bacterium]|nr:three-Cys-motif partner protein TcmP [Thermoguttaceae bacterium]
MAKQKAAFDEIGYWSEIKLEIIKEYAAAYSQVLSAQRQARFEHVYIDGFAGSGLHLSKTSGQVVAGSPLVALQIQPPFKHYYFIDIEAVKVQSLEDIAGEREDVDVFHGDCNEVLLERVFPHVRYDQFKRGLCLLDPYGLHLDWQVIRAAGQSRSIEVFLNFPVADMNRNVLWRHPERVPVEQLRRMRRYWGDETWRDVAYTTEAGLFGDIEEKASMEVIVAAFRKRLREVAQFRYVPQPIPMRNNQGAVVYYLYFASQNQTGARIASDILNKYRDYGMM